MPHAENTGEYAGKDLEIQTDKHRGPHGALSAMTGAALLAARKRLGMTQAELGDALGIARQEVYKKEAGLRAITKVQAVAIRGLLLEAGMRDAGETK